MALAKRNITPASGIPYLQAFSASGAAGPNMNMPVNKTGPENTNGGLAKDNNMKQGMNILDALSKYQGGAGTGSESALNQLGASGVNFNYNSGLGAALGGESAPAATSGIQFGNGAGPVFNYSSGLGEGLGSSLAGAGSEGAAAETAGGIASGDGALAALAAVPPYVWPLAVAAGMTINAKSKGNSWDDIFQGEGWGGQGWRFGEALGDGDISGMAQAAGGPFGIIDTAANGGNSEDYLNYALGPLKRGYENIFDGANTMDWIRMFANPSA